MKLVLEAVAVELDTTGHIKSRIRDCSDIAMRMDGTEIDGVSFSFKPAGDIMEMCMEGPMLSEQIKPNYPAQHRSPVMQVGFKSPEGRFTANTINKLIRKANKVLGYKTIMLRNVKGLSE